MIDRLITDPSQFSEEPEEYWRPQRRRLLRERAVAVKQLEARERRAGDDPLPDLPMYDGQVLKGEDRCGAIFLLRGDCRERRRSDSAYCMYHDKLQKGLTEPTAKVYPVWPLPEKGYVLLEDVEQQWVA